MALKQVLLPKIFDLIKMWLASSPKKQVKPAIEAAPPLDWDNPKSMISKSFSVHDITYLPSWKTYHKPSEEEKVAILILAERVEKITSALERKLNKDLKIITHVWMRPAKANCPGTKWDGLDYNAWIYNNLVWKDLTPEQKALKRVPNSPHKAGSAIDFHFAGYESAESCAKIRAELIFLLEEHQLRCENISGTWIHLDSLPVVSQRFFKP